MSKSSFGKNLNKLSKPRLQAMVDSAKSKEISRILRKCKKLMSKGSKFKVQMSNF